MKKILIFLILGMFLLTTVGAITWDNVAYYGLARTTGEVNDAMNNFNGTNNGSVRGITGYSGNGFGFNGDDSFDTADIELDNFTINLMVNATAWSGGGSDWIMPMGDTVTFIARRDTGLFRVKMTTGNCDLTTDVANLNRWEMWSVSYNGTDIAYYLNGSLLGSSACANTGFLLNNFGDAYSIGGDYDFYGEMDEIMIWNRSLESTEISDIWDDSNLQTYGGAGPPPNVAPNAPTIISPTNGSTDVSINPLINFSVSDSNSDAMNVTVYSYGEIEFNKTVDYTNPGIAYDPINGTMWGANWDSGTLIEYWAENFTKTGYNISTISGPQAMVIDETTGNFLVTHNVHQVIFNMTREGVFVNNLTIPSSGANGIDIGLGGLIYYCRNAVVYTMWKNDTQKDSFGLATSPNCDGLAVRQLDGADYSLWISHSGAGDLYEFWLNGTATGNTINPTDTGVEGLDFKNNYTLWHANDNHSASINIFYQYILGNGTRQIIHSETDVSSGSFISFNWIGRVYETLYEWYVTITDGIENTVSDVFSFTTQSEPVPIPETLSVNLNSPENNSVDDDTIVTFNATSIVTNGTFIKNMSLWTNEGGTWSKKNSTEISNVTAVISTSAIAYYKMDETTGIVVDEQGNYPGTNNGATRGVTGKYDNAFNYDGSDSVNTGINLNYSTEASISLWVKADLDQVTNAGLVSNFGTGSNNYSINILYDADEKIRTQVYNVDGINGAVSGNIGSVTADTWYHIVSVYDNGNLSLYVDDTYLGSTILSGNSSLANSDWNFLIGRYERGSTSFDGTIDEVLFWDSAISRTDINELYNGNASTGQNISTQTWTRVIDSSIEWNVESCGVGGNCFFSDDNYSLIINTFDPIVTIETPNGTLDILTNNQILDLNYSINESNLDSCWYEYNNTNTSISNCTENTNFTYVSGLNNITLFANDTFGNMGSSSSNFTALVFVNNITYQNETYESQETTISADLTLTQTPLNITLVYNDTNYIPSVTTTDTHYSINKILQTPITDDDTNVSFFFQITFGSTEINTSNYTQLIRNFELSTNCTDRYSVLNFSNYDEETLESINGTVEYRLRLLNANDDILYTLNGTNSNEDITLCSNVNLSESSSYYDLIVRYYKDDYAYETYIIQPSLTLNLPYEINLYYLNDSIGTSFLIYYKDHNYLEHPGAVIQIQRQYIDSDSYKVVEIPQIEDGGTTSGTFNANKIKYRLVVIEDNTVLDTFENIYPKCQNVVLGTCEIKLLGEEEEEPISDGDFSYSFKQTNTSIKLKYVVPSGTPKNVRMVVNQSSRFLKGLTLCNKSTYASGGSLECLYNSTVGDSFLDIEMLVDGESLVHGDLLIPENINLLFLGNNYFIGFFMLLVLVLIFISSGIFMVAIAVIGVCFLGVIFLIKSNSLNILMVGTSIMWLIIAGIIIIYKMSQKEERT